jgi:protein SCO1/2
MMRRQQKIILIIATGLVAVLFGFLVSILSVKSQKTPEQAPARQIELDGRFSLVDETGQSVTQDSYGDRYRLVYFGFSFCPDVCPMQLDVIANALDIIARDNMLPPDYLSKSLVPLFISLDPQRDSPTELATYTDNFHPALIGLTGTAEQVKAAAAAYKVFYQSVDDPESTAGYTVDHSSIVYLMGPDNRYRQHFTYRAGPQDMATAITDIIAGEAR